MKPSDGSAVSRVLGTRACEERQPLGWDEIGAVAILLVAAVRPRGHVWDSSVLSFVLRAAWWIIYAAAAARLVQRFGARWLAWTMRHQPALCVLLALALASALWSLEPAFTLQKALSLAGTTVAAVFIGTTCSPERLMRVLYWTFTLLIVCSIAVALALPAPDGPIGWRGIVSNKNAFGVVAVWASIFFLLAAARGVRSPRVLVLCGFWIVALALSRSRTAWVAFGVTLAAFAFLRMGESRPTRATMRRIALGLVLGVSVLPFLVGPVASLFGNDNPLKGRTRLWAGTLTILRERPATGYGYAVVWGRKDATLLPHVPITARRWAKSAHNGVINVASELGIPAAVAACVYLFGALYGAGRLVEREPSAFSVFALLFLLSFAVMSFNEAPLLRIHSFAWMLFVALTVAVERALDRTGSTVR